MRLPADRLTEDNSFEDDKRRTDRVIDRFINSVLHVSLPVINQCLINY